MTAEKKNTLGRLLVGTFGAAVLTIALTGSAKLGGMESRIVTLESQAAVQQMDHDLIIQMNTRQRAMMERLERMEKKLDQLNGDE